MAADFTAKKDALIGVLAGKYEAADLPDPQRLARKTVDGFLKGHEEMADRFRENITHAAFFDYANADGVIPQLYAGRYLKNLPGVLEELKLPGDAERARRILAVEPGGDGRSAAGKYADSRADLSAACRRILAESETGLDGVRAALINYHRACAANLLGEHACELGVYQPPNYDFSTDDMDPHRYFSSEDYTAVHIARTADYLIAGWKAGLLPKDELEQAAFALGHTSGAAQEALHQAAVAFDHDAYQDIVSHSSDSDWAFFFSAELGIVAGEIVAVFRTQAVEEAIRASTGALFTETLRDLTLMEMLSIGVPAVLAGIAVFALVMIIWELCTSPRFDEKHNLIASEAADRTRLVEPSKPDDGGDDDERDGWIRVIAPPEPQDEDNEEDDDPYSTRSEQESER